MTASELLSLASLYILFRIPELQIREGIEDNSKIFFSYFSTKTYCDRH